MNGIFQSRIGNPYALAEQELQIAWPTHVCSTIHGKFLAR
jgi:hypothetical protein